MKTEIEIGRLSIGGMNLGPRRTERLLEAIGQHLQDLIAERGLPPGAGPTIEIDRLQLPHTAIRPGAPDGEIARQIAQAAYRSLREMPRS